MHVTRITTDDELDSLALAWNHLAVGVPFRSWDWLATWWRHYAGPAELFTLCVRNHLGAIVAIAPWYLEHTATQGRVVRFLGSGEVCSDYLGVLCEHGVQEQVAEALAAWLTGGLNGRLHADRNLQRGPFGFREWDLLELTGIDGQDSLLPRLADLLADDGQIVHRRTGPSCWRLELPERWEDYLAGLSKSHRKQIRRREQRSLATGKAVLHTVEHREELPRGLSILMELHQRRRRSLGERGCFASPRFAAFLRDVSRRFLAIGRLRLHWLEVAGQPAAAEYHLAGRNVVYGYQAGVAPELLSAEPGRLITIATLKQAQAEGFRGMDFLRGDEPYKAHWRARPRPSLELRIVPNRAASLVRHQVWLAGQSVKNWVRGRS